MQGFGESINGAGTVAAIVPTYNRESELRVCLRSLLAQTTPLGAVYVIDNGSTTEELLRQISRQGIRYVRLPENTGSAGGFRAGMELAFNDGFEWLWITDNDSIPRPDSLEALLRAAETHQDVLAFAPMKIRSSDGGVLKCDGIWDPITHRTLDAPGCAYQRNESFEVDWTANTGLLVHRKAIEKIGHMRADLFAFGEDNEYCRRLRRITRILVIPESRVAHPEMGMGWPVPAKSLWKLYYLIRNDVFLSLRGLQRPQRGVAKVLWRWARVSLNIIRKQDYRFQRLFVVTLATWHGLVGRLGPAPSILGRWSVV